MTPLATFALLAGVYVAVIVLVLGWFAVGKLGDDHDVD